tara:strand:- start:39 stop:1181 length:1143 start_codon:yes stop_codon:yes gene_type:complete
MAKRKIKTARKTKTQRLSLDEQIMGVEPTVDYFDNHNLHSYFSWYTYMYDRKTVNQVIISYAKKFGYKNASKFSKMFLPGTIAAIIRGLENGVKFIDHKDYPGEGSAGWQKQLHNELREYNKKAQLLVSADLNTDMLVKKKRPSVQENINNKGQLLLGDVDHAIDVWDIEPFDMYKYLTEQKVSAAVANSIVNEYDDMITEIKEARDGNDEQLKEGYSHLSKSEKDNFYNFLLKIKSDTERFVDMNKPVRKPRKAKAINATKAVSKLNYLNEDSDFRVKSIDPSKIIGAKQLWLFNNKTNEMIKYDSEDRGGLMVKGTSIHSFNTKTSMSKKLGVKTDHFIDRVLQGGTIVLNKTMNEINSKASDVTGRVNNNMIILKVD